MRTTTLRCVWLGGTASTPTLGLDLRSRQGAFVNVLPHHQSASSPVRRRATESHFMPTASAQSVEFLQPEQRQLLQHLQVGVPQPSIRKFTRHLRADVYDELLKLPLRYSLHDFDTLERHLKRDAVRDPSSLSPTSSSSSSGGGATEKEILPGTYRVPLHPSDSSGSSETAGPSSFVYAVSGRQPSAVGYAPPLGPADPLDVIPFFVHRTSTGLLPGKVRSMNAKNLMPAFFLQMNNVEGDLFRFEEELLKIFPTKKIFVRQSAVFVYNVNMDGKAILHHWLLGLGF